MSHSDSYTPFTVIQVGETRLAIGFDIWLLETCQLCLIFISKGHFLLKKIIQGHKGQKGQWRPTKASIAQNFKFLCYYHYSMYNHQQKWMWYQKNVFLRNWNFHFHYIKSLKLHFVENVKCTNRYQWNNGTEYFICLYITWRTNISSISFPQQK